VFAATAEVLADDKRWAVTSPGAPQRRADMSAPQVMSAYQIGRIGLMKVGIEGGEFAVFSDEEDPDLRQATRLDSADLVG
jgi:hypothetical protein